MKRRGRKKKKFIIIPAVLIMLAVLAAAVVFFIKFQFKITEINITGSDKYTYDELYAYIFSDRNDSNMLLFKRSHKKAPDIEIPFIAKVSIETDWPGTINITVYEKSMIGYVLYQGTCMYFDKDGVIVESSGEMLDGIPEVEGLDYSSIVLYSTLDVSHPEIFPSIMNLKQYLDKYGIKTDKIRVLDDMGLSVEIGNITVLLGNDDENMSRKIYELTCMMPELEGKKGILDMEDYNENSQYIILTDK